MDFREEEDSSSISEKLLYVHRSISEITLTLCAAALIVFRRMFSPNKLRIKSSC